MPGNRRTRACLRLEREATFAAEEQVPREAIPVLTETVVEGVLAPSDKPGLDLVEETVLVALVFLVEEHAASIDELLALRVAVGREYESGFKQALRERRDNVNNCMYG